MVTTDAQKTNNPSLKINILKSKFIDFFLQRVAIDKIATYLYVNFCVFVTKAFSIQIGGYLQPTYIY